MAWCHQVTSHYLSQCGHSPYLNAGCQCALDLDGAVVKPNGIAQTASILIRTIIDWDNGLAPGRLIWTNAEILLIRTLGMNLSETLRETPTFWFKKMHLKMSSAKWRQFCLSLNVLIRPHWIYSGKYHEIHVFIQLLWSCHLHGHTGYQMTLFPVIYQMVAIRRTTFWNAFSLMKVIVYLFQISLKFFQSTISRHWLR